MTNGVAIVFAPLSIAILAALLARWQPTLSLYRNSALSLAAIAVTLVLLAVSTVMSAFAAGAPKAQRVSDVTLVVIAAGVTWGMMFLVAPPLYDLRDALKKSMAPEAFNRLQAGLSVLTVAFPVVTLALLGTWWVALLTLWTCPVAILILARLRAL